MATAAHMRARVADIESPALSLLLVDANEPSVASSRHSPHRRHRPLWLLTYCLGRRSRVISDRLSIAVLVAALLALLLVLSTAWLSSLLSPAAVTGCPCAETVDTFSQGVSPSNSSLHSPAPSASSASLLSSFYLLCPNAHDSAGYNLSAFGYAGSWPQLVLPTSPPSAWIIHEVDVDLSERQLRVPVIVLDRTKKEYAGHAWISRHKEAESVFVRLLERAGLRMAVQYEDGTQDVFVAMRHSFYKSRVGPTAYLIFPLRGDANTPQQADRPVDFSVPPAALPMSERPVSLTLHLDWATVGVIGNETGAAHNLSSSGVSSRAVLPLCSVERQMVYSAAVLKPVTGNLSESYLLQWIDYHRRVGVDHFLILDRNGECNSFPLLQRLASQGLVTVTHWPLPYVNDPSDTSDKRDINNSAQQAVYWAAYIRTRRVARWMLTVDFDEYVYLNTSYYPRACSNSLLCPSPLRDFLEQPSRAHEGVVVFGRYNFVGASPPPRYWNDSSHAWRYRIIEQERLAANHSLSSAAAAPLLASAPPYAVTRVWRSRAPIDVDPIRFRNRYGKYLYRCDRGLIYLGVHSAAHRDTPKPPAEGPQHLDQAWAAHYRDLWKPRSRVHHDRWDEQWELDTRVADIMQLELPPANSDTEAAEAEDEGA